MKRSAKICWIGFVISTIVIAAVAGLVLYFTAFKDELAGPLAELKPDVTSDTGGTSLVDHLAHAVPGFEYREVDFNGDGVESVHLDGSRSHTHYFDAGPPIIEGKLVEMIWFNKNTGDRLGTGPRPIAEFPVGKTTVGLTVTDNHDDSHTDYATVIIEKPIDPGAYCYYYEKSSSSAISVSDKLADGVRPVFATKVSDIDFASVADFHASQRSTQFQMRCNFLVKGGKTTKFSVTHIGPVRLLVGDELVLESDTTEETSTSSSYQIPSGTHTVQLLYSRSSTSDAKLQLTAEGQKLQCDLSDILPVLTKVDPRSSQLSAGGTATIYGVGLFNGVEMRFGDKEIEILVDQSTDTEVVVTVPESSESGVVYITAANRVGVSNRLAFQYSSAALPPIRFSESRVREGEKPMVISLITGIKYGPDHRYYLSAINSVVHSFSAGYDMKAKDPCTSPSLGKHRAILGLAFNPADTDFKLYVSASVLEWKSNNRLDGPRGWANGQILLLQKNVDGKCLNKVGDPVITGLPVSNHDHGVNGLVFDDDGKLHIQIGGFTNAGLNDASSRLGGFDENPLSGASLIADVRKPGFNGDVKYDNDDPAKANQIGGEVSVFSPGWRNSFGINSHSNGYLYATDNGASAGFGDMSVSCTASTKYVGKNLDDKLGKVEKGKYGGHPNRNRGRKDPRECKFMDSKEPSNGFYQKPIATFESSTDGVMEYTANSFRGQLKGDILCSKYTTESSPGKVFRVQLDASGNLKKGPDELWLSSGLSMEMSPYGQVLMPRVYKKEIVVLSPISEKGILPVFTGVLPFRGPSKGGNEVIVTGENLAAGAVAVFGDKKCTSVSAVSSDKRSFMCKVPPGSRGQRVSVSLQFSDGTLNVGAGSGVDYVYMNV
ncbi:Six-bladed beta-propeller TolB-like protein [Gracilaria domingensis]|nr:Six-bladed beta-propeller TolB-like protein [Gracilaria domingensis]